MYVCVNTHTRLVEEFGSRKRDVEFGSFRKVVKERQVHVDDTVLFYLPALLQSLSPAIWARLPTLLPVYRALEAPTASARGERQEEKDNHESRKGFDCSTVRHKSTLVTQRRCASRDLSFSNLT